jgi:hypothetical protein
VKLVFRQRSSTWEEVRARAESAFAAGRFAESRDAFREAADAASGQIPVLQIARVRRMLGESLRELADYDAAFAHCDAAHDLISTLPDSFPGAAAG